MARVVTLEDAVAFRDARLEIMERRLEEERLRRLWLIEYYQIPKRRVKDTLGVERSSVRRWAGAFQQGRLGGRQRAAAVRPRGVLSV